MEMDQIILSNLLNNEEYVRKALPYLKDEYFHDPTEKLLFKKARDFIVKYSKPPKKEALLIEIENDGRINENEYENCVNYLSDKIVNEDNNLEWLIEKSEEFCQEKALHNAVIESIHIIDGENDNLDKGSIPEILQKALGVNFDQHIGHDFLSDAEARYEFYHRKENRVPFDIEYLNLITKGGIPNKTLNIILAGTGVGKTLAMCHFAATNLMLGKNVLYITLEMAEERIAERIDANLLGIELDDLEKMSRDMYVSKVEKLRKKTPGNLIVKEYPPVIAGANHFRHLLNELKLKKQFVPDIIYVDYINLAVSHRLKGARDYNSYTYIKTIAEELRGLAVESDVPLISATQLNRDGYTNSDPDLDSTSESFGLPMTADFMLAMITSEQLEDSNQIMVKQLKNRYRDVANYRKFVVGVDKAKMRLYNVDSHKPTPEVEDDDEIPVHDRSRTAPGAVRGRKLWQE